MKSNAEIFRAAADYIREHGWIQGGFYDSGGAVCLEGALATVMGYCFVSPTVVVPGRAGQSGFHNSIHFQPFVDHGIVSLGDWNDQPERTAAEVIALLETLAFAEELKAAAKAIDTTTPQSEQITQPCTPATPTPETGELVSQPQLQEVEA